MGRLCEQTIKIDAIGHLFCIIHMFLIFVYIFYNKDAKWLSRLRRWVGNRKVAGSSPVGWCAWSVMVKPDLLQIKVARSYTTLRIPRTTPDCGRWGCSMKWLIPNGGVRVATTSVPPSSGYDHGFVHDRDRGRRKQIITETTHLSHFRLWFCDELRLRVSLNSIWHLWTINILCSCDF